MLREIRARFEDDFWSASVEHHHDVLVVRMASDSVYRVLLEMEFAVDSVTHGFVVQNLLHASGHTHVQRLVPRPTTLHEGDVDSW